MSGNVRVLVLGGNGLFGHRVGRLFSQWRPNKVVEILVGCRTQAKAERAVQALQSYQHTTPSTSSVLFVPFVTGDLPSLHEEQSVSDSHWQKLLQTSQANIVINTVGPFVLHTSPNQESDEAIESCFTMARNCALQGIHYIDLADERAYLEAFEKRLDALAHQNQVCLVTGASTTPGLTMEIVKMLYQASYPTQDASPWSTLEKMSWALSPGNRIGDEGTGAATVESILRTVGKKIKPSADCQPVESERHVWDQVHAFPFRWLGERRFVAPVDQADIDIAPKEYRSSHERGVPVACYAGIELHTMTWALSFLSRLFRWVPSLKESVIRLASSMTSWTRKLGSDRGGFVVSADGSKSGEKPHTRRFDLIAENGDGPFIPAIPSFCIACHLIATMSTSAENAVPGGAMVCGTHRTKSIFSFRHFQQVIDEQKLSLYWSVFDEHTQTSPYLYPRVMGSAFYRLPVPIRRLHSHSNDTEGVGSCRVERGTSLLSRMVGTLLHLPSSGDNVPTRVRLITQHNQEIWHRNFDGTKFYTTQEDNGSHQTLDGFLVESIPMGWLPFAMKAKARIEGHEDGLYWKIHSMSLGKYIPIPQLFAASVQAEEKLDAKGLFQFDVKIVLPMGLGLLVHYRGHLHLQEKQSK